MGISGFISFSSPHEHYQPSRCHAGALGLFWASQSCQAPCPPGDKSTRSCLQAAACCPQERSSPTPPGCGVGYGELPPPGIRPRASHRHHSPSAWQVTVTLSPRPPIAPAPCCSWLCTGFRSPEQSLGNGKPEVAPLCGSLHWGHWSSLNPALEPCCCLAASLADPDPWARLPHQHQHLPSPQPCSAAVQNLGLFFS